MKALKPFTILLFSLFLTVAVSSQTNAVFNYLPGDAKTILKINSASLRQKMKWEELMKYKMFEDFLKEVPESGKDFIKNPEHTGIDLSQGFYVVMPANTKNKKAEPVLYGVPKDTIQFTAMVKKLFPGKKAVKIGAGKVLIDSGKALAWNHEIFIITGSSVKQESVNQTAKAKAAAQVTKTKQLTEKCKTLLNKRRSPFSNEYFSSLLKEDGDLYLWINNTIGPQEQKMAKTPPVLGMLNKNLMRSANYTSGIIRFESGKVSMQMKRYMPASLDSIYSKYPLGNINTDLLRKLPAGHPIFLYSFRFSPAMVNEIVRKAGADNLLDSLSKGNIKKDDILAALKGDAMLAVIKASDVSDEDSVTSKLNGVQVFVAGSINDREKFKSLAERLRPKEDSGDNPVRKIPKPFIFSNDSIFVVSISQMAAQKFLSSPGNNSEIENIFQPYKSYPGAAILDLKTIFGFAGQLMLKRQSPEEAQQSMEILGMFDKLIVYSGQHTDNYTPGTMELTLVNKDENSLKQFLNLMDLLNSIKPKASTAYNEAPTK
jgi:uncharacterized protein DUF4836